MNLKSYLVLLATLLFFSCNGPEKKSPAGKPEPDTTSERGPVLHSMKGFELYVWEEKGTVYYHLLPGTNRSKTNKEIFDTSKSIKDQALVRKRIDQMPAGEYVFVKSRDIDTIKLEWLKAYIKSKNLNLTGREF